MALELIGSVARAVGSVARAPDFNMFMSWLQNANVDLLYAGDPDSHAAQSGILSGSDGTGIQLCQPVQGCLPLLSVARLPPGDSTGIIGAYGEDSIRWIELPPCIAGMASSLQPHEREELTRLEISRNYNAPLHPLSDIVLVEALCRSRAIFYLTLDAVDGNSSFHVECLVPLSRICKTFSASESIIVQVVDTGTMLYQFANLHVALVRDCLLANDVETLGPACVRPPWRVAKVISVCGLIYLASLLSNLLSVEFISRSK